MAGIVTNDDLIAMCGQIGTAMTRTASSVAEALAEVREINEMFEERLKRREPN